MRGTWNNGQPAKAGEKKPHLGRVGKTKRDREAGAAGRSASNKAARAHWGKEVGKTMDSRDFPWQTCNGKRNRSKHGGVYR